MGEGDSGIASANPSEARTGCETGGVAVRYGERSAVTFPFGTSPKMAGWRRIGEEMAERPPPFIPFCAYSMSFVFERQL
jgi:hypothetical protein